MAAPNAARTPVFWGHGNADPMVNYQLGEESAEFLTNELGFVRSTVPGTGLEFHPYARMGHSISPQELDDLAAWFKRVVPDTRGSCVL